MENQVIFKSVLNGFEKSAVLKYIDQLNSQLSQLQEEQEQQLSQQREELDRLEDQSSALLQELQDSKKELQEANKKLEAAQAQQQEQAATIDSLQTELAAYDLQISQLTEGKLRLEQQLQEQQGKGQKYDQAAASIGSILLEARQEADSTRREAKAQAEDIVAKAKAEAEDIVAKAQQELSSTMDSMESLRQHFAALRAQMEEGSRSIQEELVQIEKAMALPQNVQSGEPGPAEEPDKAEPRAAEQNPSDKSANALRTILEQAAAANQKKNLFR